MLCRALSVAFPELIDLLTVASPELHEAVQRGIGALRAFWIRPLLMADSADGARSTQIVSLICPDDRSSVLAWLLSASQEDRHDFAELTQGISDASFRAYKARQLQPLKRLSSWARSMERPNSTLPVPGCVRASAEAWAKVRETKADLSHARHVTSRLEAVAAAERSICDNAQCDPFADIIIGDGNLGAGDTLVEHFERTARRLSTLAQTSLKRTQKTPNPANDSPTSIETPSALHHPPPSPGRRTRRASSLT